LTELLTLLQKEFTLELRRKTVLAGLLLYLVSTVFVCYLSFSLRHESVSAPVWAALFWVLILFAIVNSSAKSFIGEKSGADIYYYSIASPDAIILSKILYNYILSTILATTAFFLFVLFLQNPVQDMLIFATGAFLGAGAFSTTLTTVSAIAAKANNNNVLIAVLGFPVVITTILPVVKITRNAIDGIGWTFVQPDLIMLVAINALVIAVSYLLFPYIWRS
jgi:heme exporter protein B